MATPHIPTVELAGRVPMPVLGLGSWKLSGPGAADSVMHALDIGYRLIDTAGDYENGAQIAAVLDECAIPRDELFLISKVEEDEDGHAATRARVEELGVDRLDLCLIHRPPDRGAGEGLWEGLVAAKAEGLTRAIGVSNYTTQQIDRLTTVSGETPAVNQIEWSPFGWSEDVLAHAREAGVVIQAYSPVTRGERLADPALAAVAAAHGKTPAQVILRWDLQLGVAVVPKAQSPEHQRENLDVFDFELADDEMERLGRLNEHYSALAGLPYV